MTEEINKKVKTFSEIEQELYRREDHLLELDGDRVAHGVNATNLTVMAKEIAKEWVKYTKLPRQDGITPRQNVAIKHVVALMKGIPNKKALEYGRQENSGLKKEVVSIPIYDAVQENVLGINLEDGEKIVPYRISPNTRLNTRLEVINNCMECPTQGRCDLVERCLVYNSETYEQARRLNTNHPTMGEYIEFDRYARELRLPKNQ